MWVLQVFCRNQAQKIAVVVVILAALPEVLRHGVEPMQRALFGHVLIEAEVLRQLLYGLAMVLIMLNRPAGLWPAPRHEDKLDDDADNHASANEIAAA